MQWSRTAEGGRKADMGNGKYLNPIVPGDHPDPTILKDGKDYYMTFSSFLSYPGIVIWHSTDLVNWIPICTALKKQIGSVWALDLAKYRNRYYVYIPAVDDHYSSIYVICADDIRGPWSDPIDLKLPGCIDPGHAVGENGKRYLFVNGIRRIELSDDGLSTVGSLEHVYNPWRYPEDWVVEMFSPEGPKLLRRGRYFYLISAVGGTAGPPTSHMVIAARAKSIHGPWEDCPVNPIIRTKNEREPWWSRGHASIVEGPGGDWWMVYHAYENGFRTLGRQTLLEPIRWTKDGWPEVTSRDLSKPLKKPERGLSSVSDFPWSDDFSTDKSGIQWSFYNPVGEENARVRRLDSSFVLKGKGTSPGDSSPLTMIVGDRSYEVEISLEPAGAAQGGLILFYDERMYCGLGFDKEQLYTYNYGREHRWMRIKKDNGKVRVLLRNEKNVITYYYSLGNDTWIKHPWQMEVSGMHHNVFGGFTSLKVGFFSSGNGATIFKNFKYSGLPY